MPDAAGPAPGPFETESEVLATPAVQAVSAAFDADPGAGKEQPHNAAMLLDACAAGTTVAEQRRRAVRSFCAQARQDKDVAEIVRLMLASRRQRASGGGNVIEMGARRG
jgi:hypothetical protein